MKNSFFLIIPSQQNNPLRLKQFEAKALQQWVVELPTANPGLATRLIHDFIKVFNATEMAAQSRLEALELLRPSTLVIEDYLRSRLIQAGFPKEENDKKILQVLISIEREFTIGYWIVLKELTQRDISWFQGKHAALAIQRTIKGLSSIVISHFIMGMPVPDWVWIDLHSLYKLSVKIKKDTTKIANDINQANKTSTPEECYLQILLLSLANPIGLMQKEIPLVYGFIETLISLVSLKNTAMSGLQMQCLISIDEDKPPHFELNAKNDSTALYLDFSGLIKAFKQREKLISATEARFSSMHVLKKSSSKPTAELLDYLEQRWSGIDLQGAPLFSDRLDRYIAVGLASTFDLQTLSIKDNEADMEFLVHSASDRLLSGVFNKTGVFSVGSLVSYRKTDMPIYKRSLGIVDRIMVTKQSGKINFGMQLLAKDSLPVTYQPWDAQERKVSHKALIYKIKEENMEKSLIITDNFMLKDGGAILIFMNNENLSMTLINRKNIGLGYWQFECLPLIELEHPAITKKGYDFI
ncbi:MAG: hypothetical protein PHY16_16590 [Methylobacter sp.]|nr:hypothetical protein [Methylobacter sp.]